MRLMILVALMGCTLNDPEPHEYVVVTMDGEGACGAQGLYKACTERPNWDSCQLFTGTERECSTYAAIGHPGDGGAPFRGIYKCYRIHEAQCTNLEVK